MIKTAKTKYRLIFMGTPEFAAIILKKLIKNQFIPISIITQPDRKIGRRQKIVFSPVKTLALRYNLSFFQPENIKDHKIYKIIKALKPDIIIVAAYGQIIPKKILDIPKFGCVNVHASLLPKYRGASPIQYAILKGEKITGVTLMQMNEKMDEGDIIVQKKAKIDKNDTTLTLQKKLAELSADLLVKTLPKIFSRKIKPIPQDNKKATYTKILKKEDGKIDWKKKAEELERQIRAFYPWPGTYAKFQIQNSKSNIKTLRIKIIQARIFFDKSKFKPGTLFLTPDKKLAVSCGQDNLILDRVQVEGKKEISGDEFVRGYFKILGSRFI